MILQKCCCLQTIQQVEETLTPYTTPFQPGLRSVIISSCIDFAFVNQSLHLWIVVKWNEAEANLEERGSQRFHV